MLEHGHIVLPEEIRQAYHWTVGQELLIMESLNGILLTSQPFFEPTTLDDVAGCLQYTGTPKTLDDMNAAIATGVKQTYGNYD